MNEPKRYKVGKIGTTEMIDCVSYEDYARLKAEVERLTAFTTRTIIPNEELQAQVERLEKAIMDSVEMRQRLREIENGNQSK